MPNKVVLFNDGEALTHGDLNTLQKATFRHASLDDYYRLVRNYNAIQGGTLSTQLANGITAVGFKEEPVITYGANSITVGACRMYIATGIGPHTGSELQFPIVSMDYAGATFNITTNSTGNDRYDVLSVPATVATLFTEESEVRDFEDSVTGALTSTSAGKLMTWSEALVYTEGTTSPPATPTGHVVLATFLVEDGNSAPEPPSTASNSVVYHWIPMGKINQITLSMADISFTDQTLATVIAAGKLELDAAGDDANFTLRIPEGSFVTSIEANLFGVGSGTVGTAEFKIVGSPNATTTASAVMFDTTGTSTVSTSDTINTGSDSLEIGGFVAQSAFHGRLVATPDGSETIECRSLTVTYINYD